MSRVTYRLSKGKDPQKKGLGYKKKFPITYSLPAISRVRITEDNGDVKVRKIRYCKNETSIFMDEQPPDAEATKIKFENGFITIDDINDYLKFQFLELIDFNGSKINRDSSKVVKFERVDLAKKAKESLDKAESLQDTMKSFFSLGDIEQQSIAAMWGIKTHNKKADEWKWILFQEVQKNPRTFKNLMDSSDMEVLSTIVEAQNTSVIQYHNNRWTFRGNLLLNVPIGKRSAEELMRYLQIHPDTQRALDVASEEVRNNLRAKSSIELEAAKFTAEQMFEMGKQHKIIIYDRGRGWVFKEPYEMMTSDEVMGGENKKSAAISYIRNNEDAKLEILHRRKMKIKKASEERRAKESEEADGGKEESSSEDSNK